ncbi:GT2 family glycosyltransferase [Ruminiclostridium sufflavum DSM 19573]|uniref:GT2 family glycosyltransferase n=1 Tax=Ruminiclostridium sufflavum DSM 19573 TaxID=1121337 RepID=A0A318XKS8_9FIRM|nr:glycosyltransferase family 2 protein [Ruminiclostridium sufflavum]PYG87790.1 GT2 family glycosyltransferase [Ruminiclostridium sufflavum DSM 19573]
MSELPFITAMIVVRNEEKYIEACFRSLLEQSYPEDRYEVLIIDGLSTDNTLKAAREAEEKYSGRKNNPGEAEAKVQVRYFDNPKKILASGWNIGIKEAMGDYVIRIDAHAFADRDLILKSAETMLDIGDAVCVGGSMKTKGLTNKGKLIANVLSSPFGVGNSKFRYSQEPQYVDTVAFGLYKKEVFAEAGYFDETMDRGEDNDMHGRIKKTGGKFYLNPEIKSTYHPRETIKSMMKQGYGNGEWNIITFQKEPGSLSARHLIPLLFVMGILGCAVLGLLNPVFWFILLSVIMLHMILGIAFARKKTDKIRNMLRMWVLFLLLHLAYGTGSFASMLKIKFKSLLC